LYVASILLTWLRKHGKLLKFEVTDLFRIELGLCLSIFLPSAMLRLSGLSPPLQLAWTKWKFSFHLQIFINKWKSNEERFRAPKQWNGHLVDYVWSCKIILWIKYVCLVRALWNPHIYVFIGSSKLMNSFYYYCWIRRIACELDRYKCLFLVASIMKVKICD
jgi:hypothetical protein